MGRTDCVIHVAICLVVCISSWLNEILLLYLLEHEHWYKRARKYKCVTQKLGCEEIEKGN